MTEDNKPKLFVTIDGEKIFASRPKFGLLKKVIRINQKQVENKTFFETEEGFDVLFQLIIDVFDTDELTSENINDVDLDSLVNLQEINDWLEVYIPQKKRKEIQEVESMKSNQEEKKKIEKKT